MCIARTKLLPTFRFKVALCIMWRYQQIGCIFCKKLLLYDLVHSMCKINETTHMSNNFYSVQNLYTIPRIYKSNLPENVLKLCLNQ